MLIERRHQASLEEFGTKFEDQGTQLVGGSPPLGRHELEKAFKPRRNPTRQCLLAIGIRRYHHRARSLTSTLKPTHRPLSLEPVRHDVDPCCREYAETTATAT
jgi:hypothetical protein